MKRTKVRSSLLTRNVQLVEFLHSPMPAVKQIALQTLVGYSQGQHAHIFKNNDYEPVKDLKKLAREGGATTISQTFTILVNLCDNEVILENLSSDEDFVNFVANKICVSCLYSAGKLRNKS